MNIFRTAVLSVCLLCAAFAAAKQENPFTAEVRLKTAALKSSNAAERQRAAEALGYMRAYTAEKNLAAALQDTEPAVRRAAALSLAWCGSPDSIAALQKLTKDTDWTVRRSAEIAVENIGKIAAVSDKIKISEEKKRKEVMQQLTTLPEKGEPADDEKFRIQTILRLLGRSQYPEALPVLFDFLNKPKWTRYAADALGDYAENHPETAANIADALLEVFPKHARKLTDTDLSRESIYNAPATPASDIPHLDSRDRIFAAAYSIMFTLSRTNADKAALKALAPLIAMQIPLDIDRLVFYEEEPFQKIIRYLLTEADVKEELLKRAFGVLTSPPQTDGTERAKSPPDKVKLPPEAVCTEILRGGDEPVESACNVAGWKDLFLIVDAAGDNSMDRVNWADAKLQTADGKTVYLDTLKPVFHEQEYDTLRINKSPAFPDLRIGTKHFARGLHTHAYSVIQYKLDGKYVRFTAQTGVCASRNKGQGAVRFIVSPSALEMPPTWPRNEAFHANLIAALCRDEEYIPSLIKLLEHPNHWVRINAAKTLMFIGMTERETGRGNSQQIIATITAALRERLEHSKPEADYGEFAPPPYPSEKTKQGQGEYNDPTPRDREALIAALGKLQDEKSVPLLLNILNSDRNALGIRYRCVPALGEILSASAGERMPKNIIDALQHTEQNNPFHSIRLAAREELWKFHIEPLERKEPTIYSVTNSPEESAAEHNAENGDAGKSARKFVFIKGSILPPNHPFQMDSWRQCYMTTDSGPVYRPGDNLYILEIKNAAGIRSGVFDSTTETKVKPLTNFKDGYVAECEVSYDGRTVWFTRREKDSPWYHLFRINADGSGLKQITSGPFHDVSPAELPNGRIVFSSTRLGTRDEYHGYPCTGLCTMNSDGTDIQNIGFNFGRDSEPAVAANGKIIFTRLELFYSRMKTEFNLLSVNPDGTRAETLYGPERRAFWKDIHGGYGNWFAGGDMSATGGRHRVLRLTQPQPFPDGSVLLTTPAGPVLTKGRTGETLLRQPFLRKGGNDEWVIATPFPLDEKTLLVAAGKKNREMVKAEFPKDGVALGIYGMDTSTGALTQWYHDPQASCFEARPLSARERPPVLPEDPASRSAQYTGMVYCQSVFNTQDERVKKYGKLLRVVEGLPQVTRHATQTIPNERAWKNHGGTFGRDLGIIPLAADGSFAAEVPADRFIALQVLDADRNVVGNQLIWMNVRPGERKGCTGCHEDPNMAAAAAGTAGALKLSVPAVLPLGETFRFHAKVWYKGSLSDEREQRQRTVQSANWLARP
ncbi:MAG: HEAT repeat domain-containing protein [Planctomycetaceae bacterium]|nr:HEAT repeat domain-containing protein [Planctomycetaceae bacterium]